MSIKTKSRSKNSGLMQICLWIENAKGVRRQRPPALRADPAPGAFAAKISGL
jgi:hypothetical protein